MSFGDYLLIGLALVSILVIPRAIWRAWTQPAVPEEETPRRPAPPPMELPAGVRWLVELVARPFMVYDDDGGEPIVMSNARPPAEQGDGMRAVRIPVSGMDTGAAGMAGIADMGAEKAIEDESDIMPRVSAYLSDQEWFVFLVMQRKGIDYRLSANKIHQIVGGDRNEILRRVKELRETAPAQYRKLDSDKRPAELSQAGAE